MGVKIYLVGVQPVTQMQREDKEAIVVLVKPVRKNMHQLYAQIALIGVFVIKIVVAELEMKICFRQEYT